MDKQRYIVIQEWMLDSGFKGTDLIAFAIVWDGISRGWSYKSITNFATDFRITIPDNIWPAVLRIHEER